ncbi:hypothetical protein Ccrd_024249 [Cynara cardunculus var. scolymus]|uniref:Uncharacterized protein n=1 Tax=Cynara cardunculus var. scolymus TaxID=59895 RepID=A0A118JSL1_CYNCS|nr:hypothetical protein Ccrd_024249 [Cynara cardunculus var. scolymus]
MDHTIHLPIRHPPRLPIRHPARLRPTKE